MLTLYTSMPQPIIEKIEGEFEKAYPDLDLEVIRESTTALRSRIELEIESPQGLQADLVWAADPSEYLRLIDQGLLRQYDSPEGSHIPTKFKDANNYYYGGRLISMCIVYNTNQVRPEAAPRLWSDLQDSVWKDNIISPDPRRSGSALAWLAAMVEQKGWEFIEALGANHIVIANSNGEVADRLEKGEFQVAILLDYVARSKKVAGSPLEIIYPEDGIVLIPSPIAITQTSDNIKGAETFIDYVLSPEGQELLAREGSFLSARSDVAPPTGVDRATVKNALDRALVIDWNEVSSNRIKTIRRFKQIILD
ncbi:MAG: extracellular solute-binding protein [Gemmatimonadetes bacterium]|nr:MAG: extracellular solute-binding protein [Gemmatimonadota bacterium]